MHAPKSPTLACSPPLPSVLWPSPFPSFRVSFRHFFPAMALAFVWEWMTDALLWKPFPSSLSQAIESSFQAHHSSLNLCISSSSAPSHSITFQSLSACQKNWSSGRTRPVRRIVDPQSGTVEWQWWEDELQRWHPYSPHINNQIETAWEQCHSNSNSYFQASAPAGVSIRIHHRKYTIEFEADALQMNLSSRFSRKVRRRLVSPGTGAGAAAMGGQAAIPSASQAPPPPPPHVVTVPAPSVSAGAVSLSYNVADLQPYVESSDDNDCPICVMSLREKTAVKLAKCGHLFCKDCIRRWFETRPTCPVCTMAYGLITGIQPNGTMCVRNIPVGSPGFGNGLEGFPVVEIIQIEYNFPSGIQGPEHPCPGRRYTGTRRVAYLPATKEGDEVLSLLKTAWDRRLLFSVGTSITTGQRDVVTWSGVHHKTSTWGGPSNFGYPDPTYFARVKAELAEKGVK